MREDGGWRVHAPSPGRRPHGAPAPGLARALCDCASPERALFVCAVSGVSGQVRARRGRAHAQGASDRTPNERRVLCVCVRALCTVMCTAVPPCGLRAARRGRPGVRGRARLTSDVT